MSDLGSGASARELVPGDPGVLRALSARMRVVGEGLETAARELRAIQAAHWSGRAANAFGQVMTEQPGRYERAASAFGRASAGVDSYAAALEDAQRAARAAIAAWEDAQAATAGWEQRRQAVAGVGHPFLESDPGAAGRAHAQQLLDEARGALDAAAERLAATLTAAADDAPRTPGLVGRLLRDVEAFFTRHPKEVGAFVTAAKGARVASTIAADVRYLPYAGLAASWAAVGAGASPLGAEALRVELEHFPTANNGLVGKGAAKVLSHVPGGEGASGFLSDATRATPWFRGVGIAGGVVGTGTGAYDIYRDVHGHRSGDQIATDVTGTAFSASSTAFLVAPNPVTAGLVVATGAAFAGAEAWQHRKWIERTSASVLRAAWDDSIPGTIWNHHDEIGHILDKGVDLGGSLTHKAGHEFRKIASIF